MSTDANTTVRAGLLTTREMATFAAQGVLEFPGIIPAELNDAAMHELKTLLKVQGRPDRPDAVRSGTPLHDAYPEGSAIGRLIRYAPVAGVITSLVGDAPIFDHDHVHLRPAGDPGSQPLHADDGVVDPCVAFDIQLFYFPHEVEPGGAGTGYVPGTHLRTGDGSYTARYRHIVGHRQWSGPAGSLLVFHHGIWHRALPNRSARHRIMYKVRINPREPQVRRWDTSDLDELQGDGSDHLFASFRSDSVAAILRHLQPWLGSKEHGLEVRKRIRLWRYLTGDDQFDVDWNLTRLETHTRLAS